MQSFRGLCIKNTEQFHALVKTLAGSRNAIRARYREQQKEREAWSKRLLGEMLRMDLEYLLLCALMELESTELTFEPLVPAHLLQAKEHLEKACHIWSRAVEAAAPEIKTWESHRGQRVEKAVYDLQVWHSVSKELLYLSVSPPEDILVHAGMESAEDYEELKQRGRMQQDTRDWVQRRRYTGQYSALRRSVIERI